MTVNALAFYAVAVLIVLAAAAAVGLPSLRLASFGGAATVVLLAILDIVSHAYALAVIEIVVPGIAVGIVFLVLRREQYRGLGSSSNAGSRWWLGGPVALVVGLVLVVTLSIVGLNWYTNTVVSDLVGFSPAALISVLHWDAPYALVVAVVLIAVAVGAGLVIGRRSGDEQTLDQHLQARREREERARRRRDDRQAGRRRPAKDDS
jgi:NADH:ubiquinone oxidoreductase subunit 6 (subunit J)